MKKLLLTLALLLAPTLASAQCNGTFPNNTVCGNVTGSANLPRATNPSAFLGAAGGTNGQIQYNNGGALGGFTASGDALISTPSGVVTIQPNAITTGKIIDGAVTSAKILDGTIANADLSATAIPIISTRAAAAALDLSIYTSIRTLGYATAGDGGGAVFVKNNAGNFRDSYITAGTIAGGSGYTNGSYNNVRFTGGSYVGCTAAVTVAGGAVTVVSFASTYCSGYAVSDVLTPLQSDVGGTGSGATLTVTTMSTPTASFTDTAANKWQYVPDIDAFPNVRQFGAKLDWDGVDGSATNDILAFRSAMAFANFPTGSSTTLVQGNRVIVPRGASYLCSGGSPFATLVVPHGVTIASGSIGTATLKQCAGEDSATHFISLCDPMQNTTTLNGGGQFGCALNNIQLIANGASNSSIAAVYSKSGQQFPLLENVYIQPSNRGCVFYEVGVGGASNAIFNNVDCEMADTATNAGISVNSSGTQVVIRNWVFGCAPGTCGAAKFAIVANAGNFVIDTFHIENHQNGINVVTTGTQMLSSIRNGTIVAGCVNGIRLDVTNPNNTVLMENIESSCSTATILNGHAGGANLTGHIMKQITCNPGNPCN